MVECCGEDRTTPFCSMCGKTIDGHNVLYGLLSHIQRTIKSYERRKQTRLEHCDNADPHIKTIEKKMKKWVDWQDAVICAIVLVDKQPTKQKPNND